jgi:uncharacterized protein YwqG
MRFRKRITRLGAKMSDTFDRLANAHGFGDQVALLRRYLLPCVGFTLRPTPDSAVGSSRLGGGPDLPPSFNWPTNEGRALDFLLQVNLTDMASMDAKGLFPPSGLLTFFYDLKEQPWGYDPKDLAGYAIRLFPTSADLRRCPPPDSETALAEAALRFWPAETLPGDGSRAGDRLIDDLNAAMDGESDLDCLSELSRAVFLAQAPTEDGPFHHFGGHSNNVQGDMQLEAQLVMNGLYCGDSSGYNDPRAAELERSCEDWSLLLQLDSDDDGGFMWGDCGMLYYWAHAADISRRDFTKAWMTLQCS